jgi:hypothetical protein
MADSAVFVTTGDAFEIAQFDLRGTMLLLIKANGIERRPIPERELERVRREQLDRTAPQYHARLRRTLEEMTWPEFYPVIDGMLMGADQCLWFRHNQRGDGAVNQWWVLAQNGLLVGAVHLPADFVLKHVTPTEIFGYIEDGLGVREATAYHYARPPEVICT